MLAAVSIQPAPSVPPTADPEPASAWVPPSPTNAGKIFRWGNKQWGDEFEDPLLSMWKVNRPGMVRDQHGMLTLDAPQKSTNVIATLAGHNRTYGRWEARVRGHLSGRGAHAYTRLWELVPSNQPYHCAAGNMVLSQYTLGTNTAIVHVRNLPNADFTTSKWLYLNDNEFHTYAVEVTPDHVSWFVDTKVIRTERRPGHSPGVRLMARFRLQGCPGGQKNGPDADGLGPLLHARAEEREVDRGAAAHEDGVPGRLLTRVPDSTSLSCGSRRSTSSTAVRRRTTRSTWYDCAERSSPSMRTCSPCRRSTGPRSGPDAAT